MSRKGLRMEALVGRIWMGWRNMEELAFDQRLEQLIRVSELQY